MAFKYFQKIRVGDKLLAIDKLSTGESIRKFELSPDGKVLQTDATIGDEYGIFPKKAWMGYRVRWEGGELYGTKEMALVVNAKEIVPVHVLDPSQHRLTLENGECIAIQEIANGQVLCGRKEITLANEEGGIVSVNGALCGDKKTEELCAVDKEIVFSDKKIFPGNTVMRMIRLGMMRIMGEDT